MEQEKSFSSEESLQLITSMISKAKDEYYDTGLSALLWGSLVIFCSLVTYANVYLHWHILGYVWWLMVLAIVPQILISVGEGKARRHKTRHDDLIGGVWISYGIAIFLFSYLDSQMNIADDPAIYLTLFGIPTFATGYGRRFRPMIVGGLACWVFAVISLSVHNQNVLFLMAGGGLLAWFIPGLILRKCYLEAKRKHV
jgi:hypothetical protein